MIWVLIAQGPAFPKKKLISSKMGFYQQKMELHLEPSESLLAHRCTL